MMKDFRQTGQFILVMTISVMAVLTLSGVGGCTKETGGEPKEDPFVRLLEEQVHQSEILNYPIRYSVLLPEEYENSTDSFPVVYLLHGFGDNHNAWHKGGAIQHYSDVNKAETGPMIFVMPQGFNTYYVNKHNGSFPYMDMFVQEFVPAIDSIFRTKKSAQQRAVMGYSMGGYGALILPSKHPDVFSVSIPLSISFRTDEQYMTQSQGGWDTQFGSIFGGYGATGSDRLTDYFLEHSPFHYFNREDLSEYSGLKIFLDCGDDEESLHITNGALHNLLRDKGFPHENRVRNGGHSWNYWHSGLKEALSFISHAFKGIPYPAEPIPVSVGDPPASGQYKTETPPGTEINLGIFMPENYESTTDSFPVIYFLHDLEGEERQVNLLKMYSLLNNKMKGNELPHSMIIEIPVEGSNLNATMLSEIISYAEAQFRIKTKKQNRVVIANGTGGASAMELLPGFSNSFNAVFLFGAKLSDYTEGVPGLFHYVDLTDKAEDYKGNYDLFLDLRGQEITHEYRLRQGTQSFQSVINGLNMSISLINVYLKK
jgi:S-formylglutathione hydrolase FrmB